LEHYNEPFRKESMTQRPECKSRWARVWIDVGAVLFVFALAGSAAVIPQLRLLHVFQAFIYVAVIVLARRDSGWGFGAGVTVAVAWNSLNLLVTHLFQAGSREFWSLVRTGHVHRPDTMMVFIGGVAHFILITGCLVGFLGLTPGKKQWGQFVMGGVLSLAYFALIIAAMAPR
jgi:hypothetical protein